MSCKNTYLLSALVVALLYFVIIKPIHHKKTNAYMSNNLDGAYKYGGVQIRFNNDPSDINYYSTNLNNEEISIPNSQILTNKSLYKYESLLVPKGENYLLQNEIPTAHLSDETHFSDAVTKREDVRNYHYDNSFNRYGAIRESYFD